MLIKSALLTQASGSIGGMTASHNAGGMYLRARTIPVNPQSAGQVAVRNALSQLVVRWGATLTQSERDDWDTYAFNTPLTNSLGDQVQRSGQQMYIRGNVARLQQGLPIADTAPTEFNLGTFTAPTFAVASGTGLISVTFENTDEWANEDDAQMVIAASRPQSPGITFFVGPYRVAGGIDGDGTTPPTSPTTIAVPFPVSAGQKVFLTAKVTRADGRLSSPFRGSVIAT